MKPVREHILPFHHKIVHIKVPKTRENRYQCSKLILYHTDGQYGFRVEIALPASGLDRKGNMKVLSSYLKKLAKTIDCFPKCIEYWRIERTEQWHD
jgi:hypothetical protein